uniref:Uncharacterized protein n=1 Tax=Setaria italica TaxID=4555 RepID=K3Y0Q9_SETIT
MEVIFTAILGEVASRSISLLTGKYSKEKQHQLQMKCNTTYKFCCLGFVPALRVNGVSQTGIW